jgi:peptidoglycan hydrolase-like protein with peptidoglycan-binding domain
LYSCGYYSGTATTREGQTGSAAVARIKEVQCLINLGYYGNTPAVDGSFGPATLAGVKYYQGCSGITVDGIVGPNTRYQLRNNANC